METELIYAMVFDQRNNFLRLHVQIIAWKLSALFLIKNKRIMMSCHWEFNLLENEGDWSKPPIAPWLRDIFSTNCKPIC